MTETVYLYNSRTYIKLKFLGTTTGEYKEDGILEVKLPEDIFLEYGTEDLEISLVELDVEEEIKKRKEFVELVRTRIREMYC